VLNKELPFLRICLPLCLGIISGYYYHPGNTECIILIIFAFLLLTLSLLFNRRLTNPFFGFAFYLSVFIAGTILFTQERNSLSDLNQEPSLFSGVISDFPEEKENSFMVTVKLSTCLSTGNMKRLNGSVILYLKKDSLATFFTPGDNVVLRCTPLPLINRGNPYEFDYRFYMQSHGIKYYSFASSSDIISINPPSHRRLIYRALIIRNRIIEMFSKRGITGKRLALASAITLGEKSHLDPDQKQYFINAGIMHIMAVSGLHAVILSYFIFSLLFFLRGRLNILRIVITIIFLWAFAFITGLTPSVLRATLMFSFLQGGKLLRRPVNSLNSVLASAFILILMRPSVTFDAGFLLSYAAVFYIIIFYREFYLLTGFRHRVSDLIWQSASVTITAQAGTLPLTIMLFNRFPTWFILTNVVIVPVSSLLIITGCLVPLTFPLVHISQFLTRILDMLTWLTEFLTEKAASLPLSTIDNIGLTPIECIILSAAISLLFWYLLKKPRIPLIYPLMALLLFSITYTSRYFITGMSRELVVYNTAGEAAIGLRTGRKMRLFSKGSVVPKEVIRHCSVLGLKIENTRLQDEPLFVNFENHSILISDKYDQDLIIPPRTDFLIFTSSNPFPAGRNKTELPDGPVIITVKSTRVPLFYNDRIGNNGTRIWQVIKSGAYCKRL
jgi:competence protein ComEC